MQKDQTMGYDGKTVLEYLARTHDTPLLTSARSTSSALP